MKSPAAWSPFAHPCTGASPTRGFPAFLARELGAPRANLKAFAAELDDAFEAPRITLTNSGSSAVLAAALALAEGAGPRPEALVGGFTFPTTLSSLLTAGFSVRAVDTEPGGFGLDPDRLARAVGPRTRLVCLTHFLGLPARVPEVARLCRQRKLALLQDACETMGLRLGGRPAHAWGDLTAWSFYHPHHLSAFGGGAVLSPDERLRRRVESVVHWGRACTCHYDEAACRAPKGPGHYFTYERRGHNLEMSELNACYGRFALRTWPAQEAARRRRWTLFSRALAGVPSLMLQRADLSSGSPFAFPVTLAAGSAERLAGRLARRGVEARTLLGGCVGDLPAFRGLRHDGLRNARALARSSLLVGIHQTLPEAGVREAAAILREEVLA